MTESQAPEVVTPEEFLERRESVWSRSLRGVSLVAEALAEARHSEQALRVLALKYRRAGEDRWRRALLRRWPAVQVMSTVGVATERYEHGTLWPQVSELAGASGQQFQTEWGRAFLDNLESLGLPDFSDIDDPGARFVGPILMHSGVPTYCLGDYFSLVVERRRRIPGLEAEEFVAWAAARASEGRLHGIDKPVERFLRYGGEFAVDVSDRIFELLDIVGAGGSGEGVPLPSRFSAAARDFVARGLLQPPRPTRGEGREHEGPVAVAPHLVLDPWGRGPLLRLPAEESGSDGTTTWIVTVDDRRHTLRSRPTWPGEPAPPIDVAILAPARSATVAPARRETLKVTVPIVDDRDRLLAFSEDGRLLPARLPLPGVPVWLLFPAAEGALDIQGDSHVIAEGALPPGWAGWSLQLVDLAAARAVRGPRAERYRSVRRSADARISVTDPIPAVRSHTGAPVFAHPPVIGLPDWEAGGARWTISVSRPDGTLLHQEDMDSDGDPSAVWRALPRPLFGSFMVRVRGPWGRGAHREMTIAEGVRVQSDPGWRRIAPRGLVPATVRISPPPGVHVDSPRLALGEEETGRTVTLSSGGQSLRLHVSPPHMTVAYQSTETSTAPSIRAASLYTEDLIAAPGTLIVDIGLSAEPRLHVFSGRQRVQDLVPHGAGRFGLYRFHLAQMTDTLVTHPRVRLCLDETGQLPVATVTPQRLFSGIELVDDELQFRECGEVDGLTAQIYPLRAPWRTPHTAPISGGCAHLPQDLVGAGPLLVSATIEDPWVPSTVARWPAEGSATLVDAEGFVTGDDDAETRLSAYLAGAGPFPIDESDVRLWVVLARVHFLRLGPRTSEVGETVAAHLREKGAAALEGLCLTDLDADEIPALLIRSKAAWTGIRADHRALMDLAWSDTSALPATLLWAPRIATDPDSLSVDVLESATAVCGDILDLLARGTDPHPRAGMFNEAAILYDGMDQAGREAFREHTHLVPTGLLDADSRTRASIQLLERRRDASPSLTRETPRLLRESLAILTDLEDTVAHEAVTARVYAKDRRGWVNLPALSLGFAFVARHAARGEHRVLPWLERNRPLWANLAAIGPDLATIDLMLAELLLAGAAARSEES